VNKLLIGLAISLFITSACSPTPSFATIPPTIEKMFGVGGSQFHYANPMRTLTPQATPFPNYEFDIMMPTGSCDITGSFAPGGGCLGSSIILSNDNFTDLKSGVGTESVINIQSTSNAPTTGYCKLALYILTNQDGYLNRIYNSTTGVDLTPLVYPSYCWAETGPNLVDGKGPVPSPEFGFNMLPLIFTLVTFAAILISYKIKDLRFAV
jgi:hypothetical protein